MAENPSPKKISNYDKFQALRRKPSYRADYWDFLFWCRENHIDEAEYLDHPEAAKRAEELCKKYSITYLFNPSIDIPKHWGGSFFNNEEEAVKVIYPRNYRELTEDEIRKGIKPRYLPIPVFNDGEELLIRIDIRADKEVIINNFIDTLEYYQSFIPKNNSRMTSDRKLDKWKVWDAYNETKSFKKAAERLNERTSRYKKILIEFGFTPESFQKLNVTTIRKAYCRAFELIYEVKFDPLVHKPEKLPIKLKRTCDNCPERATCEVLCPQLLEYLNKDSKSFLGVSLLGEHISSIPDPSSSEKINIASKTQKAAKFHMVVDKNLNGSPTTCEKCGAVYFPSSKKDRKCPFCD